MISAEKIYVELLELYHNSGREFYAEMACLVSRQRGWSTVFLPLRMTGGKWSLPL